MARVKRISRWCRYENPAHHAARRRSRARDRLLPESVEQELNLSYHTSLESLAKVCDVVTLNCPLYPETEHMINEKTLKNFKRGAYLINTARGKLCDRDAIVSALESGQLSGYVGGTVENVRLTTLPAYNFEEVR